MCRSCRKLKSTYRIKLKENPGGAKMVLMDLIRLYIAEGKGSPIKILFAFVSNGLVLVLFGFFLSTSCKLSKTSAYKVVHLFHEQRARCEVNEEK